MNKLIIGKNTESPILAYENALVFYVYGRVTLNTDGFLFLLPSIFYFYHHAIEVSIKTLLQLQNIKYKFTHETEPLLQQLVNSGLCSKPVNDLLQNQDLIDVLKIMDQRYQENKYYYPGYSMQGVKLRELVDDIIFNIFEEINSILKSKNHALAKLNVPEAVESIFFHNLTKNFSYMIISLRLY